MELSPLFYHKGCRYTMDWKAEAIDKLQGYEAQQRAVDGITGELERLGAAKLDGMPRTGINASARKEVMVDNIQSPVKERAGGCSPGP